MDRHVLPVRVRTVAPQRMDHQVQLEAQGQDGPIPQVEVQKQRHLISDIADVVDAEDIQFVLADSILQELARVAVILLGGMRLRSSRLRDFLRGLPSRDVLAEHVQLLPKPVGRLYVLNGHLSLSLKDPVPEALLRLLLRGPYESDLVEALVFRGQAELRDGRREARVRDIRSTADTAEPCSPLGCIQLCLGRRLLGGVADAAIVRLLGNLVVVWRRRRLRRGINRPLCLLRRLVLCGLKLPLALRIGSLARQLRLTELLGTLFLPSVLRVQRRLLVPQDGGADALFEGLIGLSDGDDRYPSPTRRRILPQSLGSRLRLEVSLHLHDDEVSRVNHGESRQSALHAPVAQPGDGEAGASPVIGPFGQRRLRQRPWETAGCGPVRDLPFAELGEARVLLEEPVEPIEAALVGETDGEDHLVLAAFRNEWLANDNIVLGRVPQHPASERQTDVWRRPEVDMQRGGLVRDGRIQRFAPQARRQRLGAPASLSVHEE
mmetsp:Transcript_21006/g.60726  ORF Transcript_21006/g.60726 Transcript_21006/m.60726 type:complete len:492 (+) Transcript_21006:484-1959(+)